MFVAYEVSKSCIKEGFSLTMDYPLVPTRLDLGSSMNI